MRLFQLRRSWLLAAILPWLLLSHPVIPAWAAATPTHASPQSTP